MHEVKIVKKLFEDLVEFAREQKTKKIILKNYLFREKEACYLK